MEIVLLEDVKALGKKGQVVKVNDGYARNFILPKKLGVEATSKNLNDLKLQKANAEKVAAEQLAADGPERLADLVLPHRQRPGRGRPARRLPLDLSPHAPPWKLPRAAAGHLSGDPDARRALRQLRLPRRVLL